MRRRPRPRRQCLVCVLVACVLLVQGCGTDGSTDAETDPREGLKIASFDFAESILLAELYAQAIAAAGVPVIRVGPVGPREIVAPAMTSGQIDLVPEYLGAALAFEGGSEPSPDSEFAFGQLLEHLSERGLVALEPSEAEDKNVFVVTAETASALALEAISDLSAVAWSQRFGGPPECRERDLCLVGLQLVYGISFAEFVPQRSMRITAESLRLGEVDVALMFSTAPELDNAGLRVLVDDKRLQPAENVVPVIRIAALDRWGTEVEEVLGVVSSRLTTEALRALNLEVSLGASVRTVAEDWLVENGIAASG